MKANTILRLFVTAGVLCAASPFLSAQDKTLEKSEPAGTNMLEIENRALKARVARMRKELLSLQAELELLEAPKKRKPPQVPKELEDELRSAIRRLERFGGSYYERADYKGAWPLLKSAVDLGGKDPETAFRLAYCYSQIAGYKEAAVHYEIACKGFEKQKDGKFRLISALNNLSAVLIKDKRYSEAVKPLERIIALEPKYAPAWYNLGVLYETHMKQPKEAVSAYRKHIIYGGAKAVTAVKAIERCLKKMKKADGDKPARKDEE